MFSATRFSPTSMGGASSCHEQEERNDHAMTERNVANKDLVRGNPVCKLTLTNNEVLIIEFDNIDEARKFVDLVKRVMKLTSF